MRTSYYFITTFVAGCLLLVISNQLVDSDAPRVLVLLTGIPGSILAILGLMAISVVLSHYAFSRVFESRERGRLFIEILAMAEKSGQSIEQTIIEFSRNGNRSFGEQFDQVARHIESGLTLPEALEKEPGCLPAQTVATLKVGYESGKVSSTLPVAREELREKGREEAVVATHNKGEYLVVVFAVAVVIVWVLMTFVIPKFKAIFADMLGDGGTLPGFTLLVLAISEAIKSYAFLPIDVVFFLMCAWVIRRIGGPRLKDQLVVSARCWLLVLSVGLLFSLLLRDPGPFLFIGGMSTVLIVGSCMGVFVLFYCDKMGWFDWFRYLVPWRRKRLQRDFSHILALLLDSGIPEAKAVELAAEGTANGVIKQRARKASAAIASGSGITEAVKLMDDSREFQWRLTNALQTESNFVDALDGWHRSLSARADRQQQTFVSLMGTSLLLTMGLIVGSIMIGMFLPLIELMEKIAS